MSDGREVAMKREDVVELSGVSWCQGGGWLVTQPRATPSVQRANEVAVARLDARGITGLVAIPKA
jgi:hypothetical protein